MTSISAVVDYDRSFIDLIANGQYFNTSPYVSEENFPRKKTERGIKKVYFRVFCFNRDIESEEVIQKMRDNGCRPATTRELLLFRGAVDTEFFKKAITALDLVRVGPAMSPNVPAIWNDYGDNLLVILCPIHKWFRTCHFLAVFEQVA